MDLAQGMLTHWGGTYGDESLLAIAAKREPTDEELQALATVVAPFTSEACTSLVMVSRDVGETFSTPQRRYGKINASDMLPDPANATEYADDHTPESVRKVGAWRWKIVAKHKDTILPLIQNKRTIDFGGLAGPIGYGSIIVDHGSDEYRALYDVEGRVDTIFTAHTLEHVRDHASVMFCMFEKLKSGGHLIAVVPSWRFEYLRAENYPHHYHTFRLRNDDCPLQTWTALDVGCIGCSDILLADDDGESIIVIARKR